MIKTKLILLSAIIGLSACTQGTNVSTSNLPLSPSAKLKTCTLEKAAQKIENGTAFSQPFSTNVEEIASSCVQQLALQSSGMETQATQDATSALQKLMQGQTNSNNQINIGRFLNSQY